MNKLFIILTLLLSVSAAAIVSNNDFQMEFGILESDGEEYRIAQRTRTIPFKTIEEGQMFGIVITPPSDDVYSFYSVSYLPAKPSILKGYSESEANKELSKGYKSETRNVRGKSLQYFFLHDGDPLGEYVVDVYIDGELKKRFTFNVVEAK